jgi:hypothetical protein
MTHETPHELRKLRKLRKYIPEQPPVGQLMDSLIPKTTRKAAKKLHGNSPAWRLFAYVTRNGGGKVYLVLFTFLAHKNQKAKPVGDMHAATS